MLNRNLFDSKQTKCRMTYDFTPQLKLYIFNQPMFNVSNNFKGFISYLNVAMLPSLLLKTQKHILNSSVFTSRLISLLAIKVFYFAPIGWYGTLDFKPSWISWTILMVYPKAKFKHNFNKASTCLRLLWIRNVSDKCRTVQTLLFISFKHN